MHRAQFAPHKARLSALVPCWNLDEVVDRGHISRGLSNLNFALDYRGSRYVLRIGREGFRTNPAEPEAWKKLAGRLPRLVAADWRLGDLLTLHVPAKSLSHASPTPDKLAEFLTTLHESLPRRCCADYKLDEYLYATAKSLKAMGALPNAINARIDRLPSLDFVSEACHNDLNSWNILIPDHEPASWIALDWEWAGNHSRLFDALNLALFLGLDVSAAHQVASLCGYLDESRYGRFELMVERYWLREYLFAAMEVCRGRESPYLTEQLALTRSSLEALDGAL